MDEFYYCTLKKSILRYTRLILFRVSRVSVD